MRLYLQSRFSWPWNFTHSFHAIWKVHAKFSFKPNIYCLIWIDDIFSAVIIHLKQKINHWKLWIQIRQHNATNIFTKNKSSISFHVDMTSNLESASLSNEIWSGEQLSKDLNRFHIYRRWFTWKMSYVWAILYLLDPFNIQKETSNPQ